MAKIKEGVWRIKAEHLPSAEYYLALMRAFGTSWEITHDTFDRLSSVHREELLKHAEFVCGYEEYNGKVAKEREEMGGE